MLRPSRLHTLSALCLLLAMLVAMPPPARAATFTAGTAAELIAAITAANGTPEADVITLTTPGNNTNGPNGLPVITDDIAASKDSAGFSGQAVMSSIGTLAPGEVIQISIFTTVLNGQRVSNTACVNASNSAGEECVSAVSVSALPVTGEGQWYAGQWGLVIVSAGGLAALWIYRKVPVASRI